MVKRKNDMEKQGKKTGPAGNDTARLMQLEKEVGFYKKIISSLDAVVLILDLEQLKLVWANDYYHQLLGYDTQYDIPLDKEDLLLLYHPEDKDYFVQMKRAITEQPGVPHTAFYRFRHRDGHYLWLFTANRLFRADAEGDLLEVVAVSIDFSGPVSYPKNIRRFMQEKLHELNHDKVALITRRERQILRLLANGKKTREIADNLGLSYHTVNNHRKNMLKKLDMRKLSSLVNFAVENGLN